MKKLLPLFFTLCVYSAHAQYPASNQPLSVSTKRAKNNICLERGHSFTYTSTISTKTAPYTIDTRDSTVTVYPVPNSTTGRCSRCGEIMNKYDKEIRVTTWRRPKLEPSNIFFPINWGVNVHRALNSPPVFTNLDDNQKVATLKNDTLYVHKRVLPFTTIREQIRSKTDTVVYYKNQVIKFKTAVFDYAYFFSGKQGKEFY